MKRKTIQTVLLLMCAMMAAFGCDDGGDAVPPDGALDTSFNGTGYVTHGNLLGVYGYDEGTAITVDSSGKILVTGYTSNYYIDDVAYHDPTASVMVIWRYNSDGTMDTTFNGKGYVLHQGAAGGNGRDVGRDIAIDSMGKIVVVGSSDNAAGNSDMALWRFNPDGAIDDTLNGMGYVTLNGTAGGDGPDSGNAVAIDPAGKIVIAGASIGVDGYYNATIWRYTADGQLDITFNRVGYATYGGTASGHIWAVDLVLDSSGRIVVAGSIDDVEESSDMVIWRFNADGTLDPGFNGKGYVTCREITGGSSSSIGRSIIIDSSENIVVTGSSNFLVVGISGMTIWRIRPDGSLDVPFNHIGYAVHDFGTGEDVSIDLSGKIMVAGSHNNAGTSEMVVWRYDPGGTPDASFNGTGYRRFPGSGEYPGDFGNAIMSDSENNILVTGRTNDFSGDSDMTIWRIE